MENPGETPPQASADRAAGSAPRQRMSLRAALSATWRAARDSMGLALLAAASGVIAMLVVRLFFGIPTPAEIFGDQLTALIPLPLFTALLAFFGSNAKHIYFGSLVIAQGIATALLVAAYWGLRLTVAPIGRTPRSMRSAATSPAGPQPSMSPAGWLDGVALATIYWLVTAGVLAPLIGGGAFGSRLTGGALTVLVAEIAPAVVTASTFVGLARRSGLTRTAAPVSPSRRRLLRQAGFALAVLAGGAIAWRFIEQGVASLGLGGTSMRRPSLDLGTVPERIVPPPTPNYGPWQPVAGQTPEITPTGSFYYVSKNFVSDPNLGADAWRLTISGLVDQPRTLTFDQLSGLPPVEQDQTLECISNEVGGSLMSTAHWTGVRLMDLLMPAGIQAGASELVFHCADGYSDSLHLAQALDPHALLVYAINGQSLPQAHGFPARLLVPGLYGMKNGKWVTGLEVGAGGYQGYWEQRGWTREARVKTTARIDVPGDGDLLTARPTFIAGVAFAGDRGIGQVDVSTDAGRTWTAANLKRPLADQTWVLWALPWQPTPGTYVVVARAIERSGIVQTPVTAPPLPDGTSGYHAITVHVG
jgi:DMSO/TMAO reductase YedYZ molybdopterin-dependent catalytic subunit